MRRSGYTVERAAPHEAFQEDVFRLLDERGFAPKRLPPNGDEPDLAITDVDGNSARIDFKTYAPDQPNCSIKTGALRAFWLLTMKGTRVYVVWPAREGFATVDTVESLTARIIGGPRRRSGKGSNTDWFLVRRGGTPFDEFFPALADALPTSAGVVQRPCMFCHRECSESERNTDGSYSHYGGCP